MRLRLLLDECIDERFRHSFVEHECQTVRYARLSGLKNGRLLTEAERANFDVLITLDRSIYAQQNFDGRRISVLIMRTPSSDLDDLLPLLTIALAALLQIRPGQVFRIP